MDEPFAGYFFPVFFVLLLACLLFFHFFGQSQVPVETPGAGPLVLSPVPKPHECEDGVYNCTDSLGCAGYRMCQNGGWSACVIKRICAPGSKRGCFVDSCNTGYETCNACGTAYEGCTG